MSQGNVKEIIELAKIQIKTLTDEITLLRTENEEILIVFEKVRRNKEQIEDKLNEVEKEVKILRETNSSVTRIKEDRQNEFARQKQGMLESLDKAQKVQEAAKERSKQMEDTLKLQRNEEEQESNKNHQQQQAVKKNIERLYKDIIKKKQDIARQKGELDAFAAKEKERTAMLEREKKNLLKFVANL